MSQISAEKLISSHDLSSLRKLADNYFASITDPTYHFGKPFMDATEAATVSAHLGGMLSAARLRPGMLVLDFGAGSGWLSRLLCQMQCEVVSVDIAFEALKLGKKLFEIQEPLVGQASFNAVSFDGAELPLRTSSFDRILVMDAFHHVLCFERVLNEFHRILKPGGQVVMVEPGPNHSTTAQAQYEMRQFGVPERDIDVREIDLLARDSGFLPMKCGVYAGAPFLLTVSDFEDSARVEETVIGALQHFLSNHRLLVLTKLSDRARTVWNSVSASEISSSESDDGLQIRIRNTGESSWLSCPGEEGHIRLGVRWYEDGQAREAPVEFIEPTKVVNPGEERTIVLDAQTATYVRRGTLDVVAEALFWFSDQKCGT